MPTLMPTLSDALTVHTQAHETQDQELHAVGLKMLALCGQTHICMDSMDEKVAVTQWDSLPGAVCVDAEAAAVVGTGEKAVVLTDTETVLKALSGLPIGVKREGYFEHKSRTPAYELWLVKKDTAQEETPECPFKVGEYVSVGWPRKHGAYKFPIAAQRVGEGYRMLQVHKDGETVTVFDKDGKEPGGLADLVDLFVAADQPENGIFEVIVDGDWVLFWDILMLDGVDCTVLPYRDRFNLFCNEFHSEDRRVVTDTHVVDIETQDELPKLDAGVWLVRYMYEKLTDLSRPLWFSHVAGTVSVGTVLPWVKPCGDVADPSGMIRVKDTGLPPLQIHKDGRAVSVYMAEGGRNRASNLPQLFGIAEQLPESFILECVWTCSHNGIPVSVERVQNPNESLADCEVAVYPYDIVLWGSEDLSGKPMYERVEMLETVLEGTGLEMGTADDGEVAFVADSVRPLDGSCGHCFSCT